MNRNILILFMSWLGVTGYGQATSPNETPITIARQGSICRTVLTEQKLGSIE